MAAEAPAYRPAIQGLRAVAVLLVVAYHAGLPLPGGYIGVDVFFVISGFVIAEMLRREWNATGQIELAAFFRRRVRRLLPALALVIVVTLVLNALIIAPLEQPARTALTGLGGLLLSANVVIALTTGDYFDAPAETNPLLHLWSLSVEEQFYLLLPVLLLLAWRAGRRRATGDRTPLALVVVLGVLSGLLLAAAPTIVRITGLPELLFGFYSPVVRTWEFLLGVALALTFRWRTIGDGVRQVAGLAGVSLVVLATFAIDATTPFPGITTLLPTVGTALLIVATESRTGRLHDVLAARLVVAIGDRSYAWYLWHWPLIVFATTFGTGLPWAAPLAAVLSLLPTWWSYRVVEQPIRAHRDAPLRPLVLRFLAVPVLVAAVMSVGAASAWWNPALADAAVQLNTRSASQQAGCHGLPDELGPERFEDCWFGPDVDAPPIYLLGDSNASSAADAVIAVGVMLERPVFATTGPNCPPFRDVPVDLPEGCAELAEATYRWLATRPAGDVVLVATDGPWFPGGGVEPDAAAYTDALRATVGAVRAAGHRAVLVTPIPVFRGLEDGVSGTEWELSSCTLIGFFRDTCGDRFRITPGWPQQPLWDSTVAVATETGAGLVDLTAHVCPDGVCRTDQDGQWDYRDGIHLSARRSAELAPVYLDAILRNDREG